MTHNSPTVTNDGTVFVHGIRADAAHATDVWNFALQGTRASLGLVNVSENQADPYTVDLDAFSGPPEDWPPMFFSGFMTTLWLAGFVRQGRAVGQGVPPHETIWASPEANQRILHNADRELALEAGRRRHAPTAPSRLCCLWLAENSVPGRNWVARMMGTESFVLQVTPTIVAASARCDARWLELVQANVSDRHAIAGYWSGAPLDDGEPRWEYLMEGQIRAVDEGELELLRARKWMHMLR